MTVNPRDTTTTTGIDPSRTDAYITTQYARARAVVTRTQVDGRAMRAAIIWDLTNKIRTLARRSDVPGDWNPAPDALDELCSLVLGAGKHSDTFEYQRKHDALRRIGRRYDYISHDGGPPYYIAHLPFVRVGSTPPERKERRVDIPHTVIEGMLDSVFGGAPEVMVLWSW